MTLKETSLMLLSVIIVSTIPIVMGDSEEKCYPPYGCFSNGKPWDGATRLNLLPDGPNKIKPDFLLYTRERENEPHYLVIDEKPSIQNSSLIENGRLHFIIHGYHGNGDLDWVQISRNYISHIIPPAQSKLLKT